jgi:ferredoxin
MANDPSLPPAKNPGFTKEPDTILVEFLPSKKVVKGFPGQKLSQIAQSGGVQIKYSCKKGDCRTCEVNFNGKIVKACQASLPSSFSSSKITVQVPQK